MLLSVRNITLRLDNMLFQVKKIFILAARWHCAIFLELKFSDTLAIYLRMRADNLVKVNIVVNNFINSPDIPRYIDAVEVR